MGKLFRPQENQVLACISSGQLDSTRRGIDAGVAKPSFMQPALPKLLRRPRGENERYAPDNHLRPEAADHRQLDGEDMFDLPSKSTTTARPVGNLPNVVALAIRVPSSTDSFEDKHYSAKSESVQEICMDELPPESFKHNLMTPRVGNSVRSSSRIESAASSGIFSMESADDISEVELQGCMKVVCDVGTQTDWIVLDDAGY